jgi:predicted benzoate:H+ symporter BenE
MKSGNGSQELTRLLVAYLTSIAFGITFLVASLVGVDGLTALWRATAAAAIAMVAGHLLATPLVDTVLTALARDEAKRQATKPKDEEA